MNKPFKVCDRVRVYGVKTDIWHAWFADGIINSVTPPEGMLTIRLDSHPEIYIAHPKQCRRLKPKKKNYTIYTSSDAYTITLPTGNNTNIDLKLDETRANTMAECLIAECLFEPTYPDNAIREAANIVRRLRKMGLLK